MEIKIDTKKDSADDIKKAIDLLQRIVDASSGYGSGDINMGSEVSSGMANLFGDTPVLPVLGESTKEDNNNDDESKDEEEKQEIEIIPY